MVIIMSECTSNCSTCTADCASRKPSKEELLEPLNSYSSVKKVIGVVSGKGGVGKSFITSYLSVLMNRKGYKSAVLDADITGPSVPKAFGMNEKAKGSEMGLFPAISDNGVKVMSINLLLDTEETPVLFRGPVIAGVVKQFWSETVWDNVDYMFVDMPPGTGDVPLTVFQSIPLDGIIIVTSPQKLVSMIVAKAVNMAKTMDIPILGVVENYSYVECGNCGERISVFGESHLEEVAAKEGLNILAKLPIDPAVASMIDTGDIEEIKVDYLDKAADYIEQILPINSEKEDSLCDKIAIMVSGQDEQSAPFDACDRLLVLEVVNGQITSKQVNDISEASLEEVMDFVNSEKIKILLCESFSQETMVMAIDLGITPIPGDFESVEKAIFKLTGAK